MGTSADLPMPTPTFALAVANDDESDEAHATTTLDGLRHAVDVNDALLELGASRCCF